MRFPVGLYLCGLVLWMSGCAATIPPSGHQESQTSSATAQPTAAPQEDKTVGTFQVTLTDGTMTLNDDGPAHPTTRPHPQARGDFHRPGGPGDDRFANRGNQHDRRGLFAQNWRGGPDERDGHGGPQGHGEFGRPDARSAHGGPYGGRDGRFGPFARGRGGPDGDREGRFGPLARARGERERGPDDRSRDHVEVAARGNEPTTSSGLGMASTPLPKVLSEQLKLPHGEGLVVDSIEKGSLAEVAGIKQYDVLEKLNDQIIVDSHQLDVLLRTFKPGDEIKLTVLHKGEVQALAVKVAQKKPAAATENGPRGRQPGPLGRERRMGPPGGPRNRGPGARPATRPATRPAGNQTL